MQSASSLRSFQVQSSHAAGGAPALQPEAEHRLFKRAALEDYLTTAMNDEISVQLLKLVDGERLLRLEHASSGLCLEKRLDAETPVVVQTGRWRKVFTSLLARELLAT